MIDSLHELVVAVIAVAGVCGLFALLAWLYDAAAERSSVATLGWCALVLTLAAVVLFVVAPSASAANVATPKMREVASWAAAKPIEVHCEGDDAEWERMTAGIPRTGTIAGFTRHGEPKIWLSPSVCRRLLGPATASRFGSALVTLLHESYTHYGAGIRDDAIQECGALVLMYEALRRWWNVPFFSSLSLAIADETIRLSRTRPDSEGACERLG